MARSTFRWATLVLASLPMAALCQKFDAPIYSDIIPTSSGLPFDPATDVREHFTAPNGRMVEVLVKGPQGSGTYSRAIQPGESPDEYFPAVVSEALQAKAHHLVIPRGTYTFHGPQLCTDLNSPSCNSTKSCNVNQYWNCQPHWRIGQYPQGQVKEPDSISDLDIDFNDSELDFSAPVIGIWILEAQRLRLRNLTVDWPSLPIASLGRIVADPDNPGHNALVIDEKYPVEDRYRGGTVQIQAVDIWENGQGDSPGSFGPLSNNDFETYFIFDNAPQPTYVGKTSAGDQTFSCISCHFENTASDPTCSFFAGCANFDIFTPGTRVVVRHYTYNGFAFLVNWSNDVNFENVKLRTGPGVGMSIANNGGNRGFRLANSEIVRGPGRLISTASDAIDLGMQADFILQGNDIGYQGDDSIAIHSTTSTITKVEGASIKVPGVCDPDPMDEPIVGDELAFFDANLVYKGTARVVEAQGKFCAPCLKLTLDHAIAGLNTSDTLLDLTQQASARFIFRDNVIHECRCHGALVNAPYGSIDHNLMYGNSAGALGLNSGNGQGLGATNLSFTGNIVGYSGQSTQTSGAIYAIGQNADGSIATSSVFENIEIENNIVVNTPGPAILLTSSRQVELGDNWIFSSNQQQTSPAFYGDLSTLDSILVYESNDGRVCGTRTLGPTTGIIGIDSTDHDLKVEPDCSRNSTR